MDAKTYFIKDLGEGSGTFIKVDEPLILNNGYLISYGDSHMVVDTQVINEKGES